MSAGRSRTLPVGAGDRCEPPGAAERLRGPKIRAQAEAHTRAKGSGGRLDQSGVDQRGARGVPDQHRLDVGGIAEPALDPLAQRLEIRGRVPARTARAVERGQVAANVHADNERIERRERPRHVHDAVIPSPVARHEEDHARRVLRLPVDHDRAEPAEREGIDPEETLTALAWRRGAVRRKRCGAGPAAAEGQCDEGGQEERRHLATTPRIPPEISAATLASIRGSATPPGDAM